MHIYQPTQRGLKKKNPNSLFNTATNESKDGFDIDEISLNKRFFTEMIIQAGNIKRKLTISIVYYSHTQTLLYTILKLICCSCLHNNESS